MCGLLGAVSGYCIVSFLCRAQKMTLPVALAAFTAARAPGIYHQPYLDDLWLTLAAGKGAMAGPTPPSWALGDAHVLVPAHGAFSLPGMPPPKQQAVVPVVERDPASEGLPPGWSKQWSKSRNMHYYFNKVSRREGGRRAPWRCLEACLTLCPAHTSIERMFDDASSRFHEAPFRAMPHRVLWGLVMGSPFPPRPLGSSLGTSQGPPWRRSQRLRRTRWRPCTSSSSTRARVDQVSSAPETSPANVTAIAFIL